MWGREGLWPFSVFILLNHVTIAFKQRIIEKQVHGSLGFTSRPKISPEKLLADICERTWLSSCCRKSVLFGFQYCTKSLRESREDLIDHTEPWELVPGLHHLILGL